MLYYHEPESGRRTLCLTSKSKLTRDPAIKQRVAERINQVFLEEWGCPAEAISISMEEVPPEKWDSEVRKPEIEPNQSKMMILDGRKQY